MEQEIKLLKQDIVRLETVWIIPMRLDMRLIYLLSIVSPWIGFFVVGMRQFGGVERQFGNADVNFELSFARSVWTLFIPFLIYGTISMGLLLVDSPKYVQYWFVRLGVYVGTILSLQFTIQLINTAELFLGLTVGYMLIPLLFIFYGLSRFSKESRWGLILFYGVCIGLTILGATGIGLIFMLVGLVFVGVALCPVCGLFTSFRLITKIEKDRRNNRVLKLISAVGCLAVYGVTAFFAINRVFDLYAQLPSY